MYFQGEYIDLTFGQLLGISTMAGKICCEKLYMYDGILCYYSRGQTPIPEVKLRVIIKHKYVMRKMLNSDGKQFHQYKKK